MRRTPNLPIETGSSVGAKCGKTGIALSLTNRTLKPIKADWGMFLIRFGKTK